MDYLFFLATYMKQPVTFHYSEKAIKEAKQRFLVFQLFLPVWLALILFASPILGDDLSAKLFAFTITLILVEGILLIEPAIIFRKLRELMLILSEESVERIGGKFTEKIKYKDIHRIDIIEKPSGEIAYIKLHSPTRKPLYLTGFEGMAEIAEQMAQSVLDKSFVQRKRQVVNWQSPLLVITISTLTIFVVLLIQILGRDAYKIFTTFFFMAAALISLIFKPVTNSAGKRFEKFETTLAVAMLLGSVALAVMLLFLRT